MFNFKRSMPVAIGATVCMVSGLILVPLSGAAVGTAAAPAAIASESSCSFGNPDVHHVIQVTFDNVHFN